MSKQVECSLKRGPRAKAEQRSCVQDGLEQLMERKPVGRGLQVGYSSAGRQVRERRRCTGEQKSRATDCGAGKLPHFRSNLLLKQKKEGPPS